MSGTGNCYDNSVAESFLKSLQAELIWRHSWQTRREVELALFEYINGLSQSAPQTLSLELEVTRGFRAEGRIT